MRLEKGAGCSFGLLEDGRLKMLYTSEDWECEVYFTFDGNVCKVDEVSVDIVGME